MKRFTVIFVIFIVMVSCQSEYESNLYTMEIESRRYLENDAFKKNINIEILDIKALCYDTISENTINNIQRNKILDIAENYQAKIVILDKVFISELDTYKSCLTLGWSELGQKSKDKILSLQDKRNIYKDSLNYF